MYYSLVSISALFITIVISFDAIFGHYYRPSQHKVSIAYRFLLVSAVMFFVFDLLWGLLDGLEDKTFAKIDTAFYFFSMSTFLFAWSYFVSTYLALRKWSRRLLISLGALLFTAGTTIVIINFFIPILFSYEQPVYNPGVARHSYLITQISMFGVTSLYALVVLLINKGKKPRQYIAICVSSLAMSGALIAQLFFPLYPFYGMGCIALIALVHAFVTLTEKDEYLLSIEKGLQREKRQAERIDVITNMAYNDALTGMKSKHAYVEFENLIDKRIREKKLQELCLFLFDLNDLKVINDTYGHETGDQYIIKSAEIIKKFVHTDHLYRYGGDEFVAILPESQYKDRFAILDSFNAYIDANLNSNEPVIAAGFADFIPEQDNTLSVVFDRADEKMYRRKRALKGLTNQGQNNASASNRSIASTRLAMYEAVYYSDKISLIDMLNSSNCDEIIEIDLKNDTFEQIFHTVGKYALPDVDSSFSDIVDFTIKHVVHPEDMGAYLNLMQQEGFLERLSHASIPNFDFAHFRYRVQGGEYRYVEQVVITGKENGFEEGTLRLFVFDITNIKTRQAGLVGDDARVAAVGRDSMTGLLTGRDFMKKGDELAKIHRDEQWCVVAIDVEHFKFFSEWFGRKKGNVLLASLGAALVKAEKEFGGVGGYLGQDDFALVMPFDKAKIEELYGRTKEVIGSFDLTGGLLPAIGVAMIEKGVRTADAFDRASVACSKAKDDLTSRIWYYNQDMQFRAEKEYRILTDFANALQNDEITFYLQPQCRMDNGAIVGAEALVRWIKKDGSMVYPSDFIPALEKYSFITDLDKYLWEKVVRWIATFVEAKKDIVPISLNVSRVDVVNLDIATFFHELCEKYHVPHRLVKLEITESSYAEITERIDDLVSKLRKDDFVVMMDDFGSGYSSLNMLSNLRLDAIKMDARFLHLEEADFDKGIHIIESIVNMAKTMALPIVVEGIETKKQVAFLSGLGCQYAQGYYFYKPIAIAEFESIIADKKKVDLKGIVAKANEQFRIREFLDENIYSDSMLNNILGPVAIYSAQGNHVDIVRYNEQFYRAVNVPDFTERLVNIEQFVPDEDKPILFNTLNEAKNSKLLGASGLIRFILTNGTMSFFEIHFYYLGRKEGADQYYGSAHCVTALADAVEEKKLISELSSENIIFVNKVYGKWTYKVSSNGMASRFGLTAAELEEELNSGEILKRISPQKEFRQIMKAADEHAAKKENFSGQVTCVDKDHRHFRVNMSFIYAQDKSSNIIFAIVADIVKDA